jgi:hypothetical protein
VNNQRLVETYLARAQELEDSAQRVEKFSPSMQASQRRRGAATLRDEAAWWRAYAQDISRVA